MKKSVPKKNRPAFAGIALIVAPYHAPVREMIELVKKRLSNARDVKIVEYREVGGSFDLPLQVKKLLKRSTVDGVIVLGAIEIGETGHGEAIANAVFPALANLSLSFEKPVSLGIIGPKATKDQIKERAVKVASEAIEALLGQLREN